MLELKSALEEQLATRLGLERTPNHDDLVVAVRAAGLLGDDDARALTRLLATFARVETMVAARRSRARAGIQRLRDKDVAIVAARMRDLLERIPR
jgi:hypothetical protein